MKRLFTFGCSFTEYVWPTWADILGQEFDYFENWGLCGSGNLCIFNSLVECITRNIITKDDTIVIMWSDLARNDIYNNNSWYGRGNLFCNIENTKVDATLISDIRGLAIRDFALIESSKRLLESTGCQFKFFSMMPFEKINLFGQDELEIPLDVKQLYKSALSLINASMFEIIYHYEWFSLPKTADYSYFNMYDYRLSIEHLRKHYNNVMGVDWPSWDEFISKKISSFNKNLILEFNTFNIVSQLDLANNIKKEKEKVFKFVCKRFNKTNPKDYHPLPLDHLTYIQQHFTISQKTKNWAEEIQNQILDDKLVVFDKHLPQRL
jgi:hypothetical protein